MTGRELRDGLEAAFPYGNVGVWVSIRVTERSCGRRALVDMAPELLDIDDGRVLPMVVEELRAELYREP